MPKNKIHRIDFSESITAIRRKYSGEDKPTSQCYAELARLWGFDNFNDCGVIESKTEPIKLQAPLSASIYLAASNKGYWLYGISAQTHTSGVSYAPNLFASIGFPSKNGAREAAVTEIKDFFAKEATHSASTRLLLRKAIETLTDYAHPTLDLFADETGGCRGR